MVVVAPPPVKRSPSLNESHYSPAALRVTEPGEKRVERRSRSDLPKSTVETQTQVTCTTSTVAKQSSPLSHRLGHRRLLHLPPGVSPEREASHEQAPAGSCLRSLTG